MKINVLFFSFYIIDLKIYSLYFIARLSTNIYLDCLLACLQVLSFLLRKDNTSYVLMEGNDF